MSAIKTIRVFCVVAVLNLSLWAAPRSSATEPTDAQELYRRAVPGVVWVVVKDGHGSGWVLDRKERLIVTNHHVVESDDEPLVVFPEFRNGRVIAEKSFYLERKKYEIGRVVMKDAGHDLAIVRLDALPECAAELALAPGPANPGQRVHSIGQPGASGGLWVYSTGFVRQVYTTPLDQPGRPNVRLVETSVPINPGDSGGPMVDDDGRVLGVSASLQVGANLVSHGIAVSEVRDLRGRFERRQRLVAGLLVLGRLMVIST
jgi:S1-C subfamily serine protease